MQTYFIDSGDQMSYWFWALCV